MKIFTSISARMLVIVFAGVAMVQTTTHAGSLDERFKAALNKTIQNVQKIENPVEKREKLEKFLVRMDQGIGIVKGLASEKDQQTLNVLQAKLQADLAELYGNGVVKVADADLNQFASYVQQDVEQADSVVYISAGTLIIILLILIILL